MKTSEKWLGFAVLLLHVFAIPRLMTLLIAKLEINISSAGTELLCYLFTFVLLLIFLGSYLKNHFSKLTGSFLRCLGTTCACYIVYFLVMFFISAVVTEHIPWIKNPNDGALEAVKAQSRSIFLILSLLIAPIVEEILFRGVIYGSVRPFSRVGAYVVSFILFALYHLLPYFLSGFSFSLLLNMIQYLPASIALCYCYEKSGCVSASIALHILINAGPLIKIF